MKKLVSVLSVMVCFLLLASALAACSAKPSSSALPESQGLVGSYSEDRDVTAEDKQIFEEAVKSDSTRSYELLKVATQVVAGTNYRFTVTVDDNGEKFDAHIFIFKPLDGTAKFVSEEKI